MRTFFPERAHDLFDLLFDFTHFRQYRCIQLFCPCFLTSTKKLHFADKSRLKKFVPTRPETFR